MDNLSADQADAQGESSIPLNLNLLTDEQKAIAAVVLNSVSDWIQEKDSFKPVRMTISAGAGRGKSFLINQLTLAIRQIFNRNDVVLTAAFTGSAAFNVGGKTCHSSFGISPMNPNDDLSEATKKKLLDTLRYIVAIFIDERSQISANILGAAERNVSMTCHGGGKQEYDWGGIPVVILLGDDYQLPPVDIGGTGKGAFYCYDNGNRTLNRKSVEINGMIQFQQFSRCVFELTKHQRANDEEFITIQDRVRVGKPAKDDITTLLKLNITNVPAVLRKQIETDVSTVYLFATRKKCSDFNTANLIATHSESNPVAIIKSKLPKQLKAKSNKSDISSYPEVTVICRGAKVHIKGKNFSPPKGLYNGAIGTVIEIVYLPGQNPNLGHFPHYVLVDFPAYNGTPYDTTHPTWVPIPTVKVFDRNSKKEIMYCPLQLSFARTIHTFQGYQAGPKLNIKRIICDAGLARHERMFPGLLYTALSRATTIGTPTDRNSSAIFFLSLDSERLETLRGNKAEHTYNLVDKRDIWTQKLKQHTVGEDQRTEDNTIQLMSTLLISQQKLDEVTSKSPSAKMKK